jgi:hypothetical protein
VLCDGVISGGLGTAEWRRTLQAGSIPECYLDVYLNVKVKMEYVRVTFSHRPIWQVVLNIGADQILRQCIRR